MLDKSFGLLFYLNKPKNYQKGPVPIYLRITVDGRPKELSTKRACEPGRWSRASERAYGTKEESKALNAYLDTLQATAYEEKRRLIEAGKLVTAASIKEGMLGRGRESKMLLQVFTAYNSNVEKLTNIDYAKATWVKYDRTKRFVQQYIQWKFHVQDVLLTCLDMEFINGLELWLKTMRKCRQNTTAK